MDFIYETDTAVDPTLFFRLLKASRKRNLRMYRGRPKVTTAIGHLSEKHFVEMAMQPNCPWVPVFRKQAHMPETLDMVVTWKPPHELLWLDTQSYVEYMVSTEDRNVNASNLEKQLATRKISLTARASETSVQRIKDSLTQEQLSEFATIKKEMLSAMYAGRLTELTELEIDRVVLMRMLELQGVLTLLGSTEREMTREEIMYLEVLRKFGQDAQKVIDTKSEKQSSAKSVFSAIEELTKTGHKLTIERDTTNDPENIINLEYDELLDEYAPVVDDNVETGSYDSDTSEEA